MNPRSLLRRTLVVSLLGLLTTASVHTARADCPLSFPLHFTFNEMCTSLHISWDPVGSGASYQVYKANSDQGPWTPLGSATTNTY